MGTLGPAKHLQDQPQCPQKRVSKPWQRKKCRKEWRERRSGGQGRKKGRKVLRGGIYGEREGGDYKAYSISDQDMDDVSFYKGGKNIPKNTEIVKRFLNTAGWYWVKIKPCSQCPQGKWRPAAVAKGSLGTKGGSFLLFRFQLQIRLGLVRSKLLILTAGSTELLSSFLDCVVH